MFKKIKTILFNIKTLIIILIVLTVAGWSSTIYFGTKANSDNGLCSKSEAKLEKLNYYALLLNKSMTLIREEKSLDVLEEDIRLLDNGTLLAEWENVVFGGNQKKDVDYYLDVIIDSLRFFSE